MSTAEASPPPPHHIFVIPNNQVPPAQHGTRTLPRHSKMPTDECGGRNKKSNPPQNNKQKKPDPRTLNARHGSSEEEGKELSLQKKKKKKKEGGGGGGGGKKNLHLVFKRRACSDIRLLIGSRGRVGGNFATCPFSMVCGANRVRGPPRQSPPWTSAVGYRRGARRQARGTRQ